MSTLVSITLRFQVEKSDLNYNFESSIVSSSTFCSQDDDVLTGCIHTVVLECIVFMF